MTQIYEIKCYYQSTQVDKVWATVKASSEEEAMQLIADGEGNWQFSKEIDRFDGDYIDEDTWEVTDIRNDNG